MNRRDPKQSGDKINPLHLIRLELNNQQMDVQITPLENAKIAAEKAKERLKTATAQLIWAGMEQQIMENELRRCHNE